MVNLSRQERIINVCVCLYVSALFQYGNLVGYGMLEFGTVLFVIRFETDLIWAGLQEVWIPFVVVSNPVLRIVQFGAGAPLGAVLKFEVHIVLTVRRAYPLLFPLLFLCLPNHFLLLLKLFTALPIRA